MRMGRLWGGLRTLTGLRIQEGMILYGPTDNYKDPSSLVTKCCNVLNQSPEKEILNILLLCVDLVLSG
jgi:hypothetical protein